MYPVVTSLAFLTMVVRVVSAVGSTAKSTLIVCVVSQVPDVPPVKVSCLGETSGSSTLSREKSTTTVLPVPGSAASLIVALCCVSQLPVLPGVNVRTPLVALLPPMVSALAACGSVTTTSLFHSVLSVAVSVDVVAPPTAS